MKFSSQDIEKLRQTGKDYEIIKILGYNLQGLPFVSRGVVPNINSAINEDILYVYLGQKHMVDGKERLIYAPFFSNLHDDYSYDDHLVIKDIMRERDGEVIYHNQDCEKIVQFAVDQYKSGEEYNLSRYTELLQGFIGKPVESKEQKGVLLSARGDEIQRTHVAVAFNGLIGEWISRPGETYLDNEVNGNLREYVSKGKNVDPVQ